MTKQSSSVFLDLCRHADEAQEGWAVPAAMASYRTPQNGA